MAPIGLAHRSTVEYVAEWTDLEVQTADDVEPLDRAHHAVLIFSVLPATARESHR